MRPLIVLGAGGTAADVLDIVAAVNRERPTYRVLGLLDDDPAKRDVLIGDARVLGPLADAGTWSEAYFVDALGGPGSFRRRAAVIDGLALSRDRYVTLVHPAAHLSPSSRVGVGVLLFPGVVVGARTVIGDHVTLLANTVVNHDVHVGAFGIAASGVNVSGHVRLGESCYLGVGSALIQGLTVGDGSLVGAGSVVIRDVPPGCTVAGNPARVIRGAAGASRTPDAAERAW